MHRFCHSCFGGRTRSFSLFYTEKRADSPNYTRFPKYGSGTTLLIIARDLCKKIHFKFNVKIGFPNGIWIMFSATCRTTYCTWPSPSVNLHSPSSSLISNEDVTLKTQNNSLYQDGAITESTNNLKNWRGPKKNHNLITRACPWCTGSFSHCHWFLPCQPSLIKTAKAEKFIQTHPSTEGNLVRAQIKTQQQQQKIKLFNSAKSATVYSFSLKWKASQILHFLQESISRSASKAKMSWFLHYFYIVL